MQHGKVIIQKTLQPFIQYAGRKLFYLLHAFFSHPRSVSTCWDLVHVFNFFKFSHVPNVSNVSYFSQTFIRPCYKRAAGGRRQKCQKARRPCSGEKQNCTERRIALTHAPSQLRGDLIDISRRSAMALCPNRFPGQNCPSDHPR